jgi:hypothetical protein
MSCFQIELVLHKHNRALYNRALERQVEHIVKNCNGSMVHLDETKEAITYTIQVCDEDAALLLRDFPMPFYVKKIDFLHNKENLYIFQKRCLPPAQPLSKKVYWLAKSVEKYSRNAS